MKIYKEYLQWLKNEGKSEITIKGYKNNMKIVSDYFWNKKFEDVNLTDLKTLKRKDLNEFRYYLNNKGNKANTIRIKFDSLLSVFEFLIDNELIEKSSDLRMDIRDIKKKIKDSKREVKKAMNKEDVEIIFEEIKKIGGKYKSRRLLLFNLLVCYGLRKSEACNLKISDFDITKGELFVLGKGAKGRLLSITEITCDLFRFYLEDRDSMTYAKNSEYVFVSRKGGKISESGLTQDFNNTIKDLDLGKKIHPHLLRKLTATQMYENGLDVLLIKSVLGHESLNTTQRYIKTFEESKISSEDNVPFKDIKFI
ncbi:MAG: tyrosine-type recombinase/integrase [Veillonella parvula]|uniref:Tyrosine-type recombinase/integrase n=1 Tax=Veillonella parvula TaxID=29466 RepID=A0A943A450_VEIPA|nr:tyrosine-type recombinase/integrase [Veillonella parvula]MBS4893802.1 tyrosine-type recombinase/integrase [Veillonella parvula]